MGRLSKVFGSSTEQLEYKLQIDILEHTAHSVSTVCTSPEAITYHQGTPFQHFHPRLQALEVTEPVTTYPIPNVISPTPYAFTFPMTSTPLPLCALFIPR